MHKCKEKEKNTHDIVFLRFQQFYPYMNIVNEENILQRIFDWKWWLTVVNISITVWLNYSAFESKMYLLNLSDQAKYLDIRDTEKDHSYFRTKNKTQLVSQLFVKQLKGLSCKSDVFVMYFVRPFVWYTTSVPSESFRFLHLITSFAYIFKIGSMIYVTPGRWAFIWYATTPCSRKFDFCTK